MQCININLVSVFLKINVDLFFVCTDKKPLETWPEEGRIVFSRVYMAYSPSDPPVLRNLNFTIEPKQKVNKIDCTLMLMIV